MPTFELEEVETMRHEHESDAEWRLRKEFLVSHYDKYDNARLLCLASCFINVECYGSTYPAGVMLELARLMEDIQETLTTHRSKQSKGSDD